jgi:hypothetical protein
MEDGCGEHELFGDFGGEATREETTRKIILQVGK